MFMALASLALAFACQKDPPSRWEKPAESSSATSTGPTKPAEPPKPVVEGGTLNKFFPAENVDGKKRKFMTEKPGFVEATLEADGKTIASLSISDTNGADDASKFDSATEKLGDYPLRTPTKKQTAVLVGKRYQVKVSSDTMSPEERKAWIQKFDLAGLASFTPQAK
jgi:hypothetical protein